MPSMRKPVCVKSSFQYLPFPPIRTISGIAAGASPGRGVASRKGSLDGWRRCQTLIEEEMAGCSGPILFFFCKITASVAILPSALLNEPFRLHASWAFSFQWVLPSECRPRSPQMSGSPILAQTAVTRTRRWILSNFFCGRDYLSRLAFVLAMIPERFVHLSAHPQLV